MKSVRSILERSTNRWVFTRRLPADFGGAPIAVSTAGGLKFLFRKSHLIDPPLLRLVRDWVRAGDKVWDIGANVGLFAFAAASRAGTQGSVLCLEADNWLVGLLRRSVTLQSSTSARVQVLGCAVASEAAVRTFHIANRARAASHLAGYGSSQTGGVRESIDVITVTLDWLAAHLPPPTVLKIDVEGAELEVLGGAHDVLRQHRPTVLCEVSAENADSVSSILRAAGYVILDGDGDYVEVSRAPWSTVAIPEERHER